MRDHLGGIGGRQDGGCETDHAIHCQCVGGHGLVNCRDQRHGVGHEPAAGKLWECKNVEEQQFLAIREIPRTAVQCAGRAGRRKYYQLSVGEEPGRGANHE